LAAALSLVSAACVPKRDYDLVQAELSATRGKLAAAEAVGAEKDTKVQSLEAALAGEQSKREGADRQVKELEGRLSVANQELSGLRGEKAGLLKDKSALNASIKEMEGALRDAAARKASAEKRIAEYRDLLARFQKLIDAGQLKVKIVNGRLVVELATDILFASGKAELSPEGQTAIAGVAAVLAQIPDRRFQVEGHTDNVPIKTDRFPSNWELASARATVVLQALITGGVAPDHLSAASFSEHHPVSANNTKEGKAANRRIEIVVVPDLSQLPGFEELNKLGGP
jgi:chemotaxis protein MotB